MASARTSSGRVIHATAFLTALIGSGAALVAQEYLDLGDIAAGGDGTGNGGGDQGDRGFTGVNIDTGALMTEEEIALAWGETVDTDGENPSPSEDFINAVFFITDPTMPINTEGVPFTFEEGDAFGASYNHVLSNFTQQLEDGVRTIQAGGREWQSAVSIHGAAGITFDLGALRSTFGADRVSKLALFAGNVDCDCAFTNIYVIYSNAAGIVQDPAATDPDGVFRLREVGPEGGAFYFSEIPAAATFLTLATGTVDDDNCCDGSVFANPRIFPADFAPGECLELLVRPPELFLPTGTTEQLEVTCLDENLIQTDVTSAVTYSPEPPGSITVNASGLVSAAQPGFTELVVVYNDTLETVVDVTVADPGVCQDLSVTPGRVLIRPGGTLQLSVSCTDGFGQVFDRTPASEGTTYAVEPGGIVSVSNGGLITAVAASGKAVVTVTNGAFTRSLHVNVLQFLDLADIVALGDGTGTGGGDAGERDFTAIDIDTGEALDEGDAMAALVDTFDTDGVNPSPVSGTDFIDRVFFLSEETMEINSAGGTFTWELDDVRDGSFGPILSNFTHNLADGDRGIEVEFRRDWSSAVGIHASAGITFDLGALRTEYGAAAVRKLGLFAGRTCPTIGSGAANVYVLFSDAAGVVEDPNAGGGLPYFQRFILENDGESYLTAIPAGANYLTLAVGSDGDLFCDHGVFANAVIIPDVTVSCDSIAITPSDATLQAGGSLQLEVECLNELGLPTSVTGGAQGTVYEVDSPVVTVSPDGLVTAAGIGEATITARNGAATASAVVRVAEFIDLGDLVAGGDGKGSGGGDRGDRDFTAVNIDTGALMTEQEILQTFALGFDNDGVNPAPVSASDSIDSVFYMNTPSMAINLAGTVFEWEDGDPDPGAWSHIYSNFTHRLEAGERFINAGGREDWETAVGIHAASGITFDLDALREKYGEQAVRTFSTHAGMGPGDCGDSVARFYVIYTNDNGIVADPEAPAGQAYWSELVPIGGISEYRGEIPAEATYLTLATGSGGDTVFCDFGTFAEARIFSAGGRQFARGDANGDGSVNITDPIFTLGYLFLGSEAPTCIDAADGDDSGVVNITDPLYILNGLFLGGPLPPAPYPDCGPDPTEDDLTCDEFARCGG